jgi:hypothetical protein
MAFGRLHQAIQHPAQRKAAGSPIRADVNEKVAQGVGEGLSAFARKAVRQRVQAVQADQGSPWDDLLGSVSTDAPPATNANVRKAMRSERS